MPCPTCGDDCSCPTPNDAARAHLARKSRFEPEGEPSRTESVLVDPEAYDASEQYFAASLEAVSGRARFVVEDEARAQVSSAAREPTKDHLADTLSEPGVSPTSIEPPPTLADQALVLQEQDPESWRQEVAARLTNYRTRRRPREPRYPSLHLKFETEPAWSPSEARPGAVITQQAVVVERTGPDPAAKAEAASARILEFPRASLAPARPLDELAEPVFDRPRIVEAPEIAPPPPALGGILIEPAEQPALDRRPGIEIPLNSAGLGRRCFAVLVDTAIVSCALALFLYIAGKTTLQVLPIVHLAVMSAVAFALFWAGYQYLLLVYSGTTPGLMLAKLALSRFDDSPAPRALRRWRVLASILSGISLGLGYAWCFLDEDQLCWHDRITHTYLAPH